MLALGIRVPRSEEPYGHVTRGRLVCRILRGGEDTAGDGWSNGAGLTSVVSSSAGPASREVLCSIVLDLVNILEFVDAVFCEVTVIT